MTQAEKEQDNGKEKEKEKDKEKDKEQQRGVKRPIAPPSIPEPQQEVNIRQVFPLYNNQFSDDLIQFAHFEILQFVPNVHFTCGRKLSFVQNVIHVIGVCRWCTL